MKKYESRLKLLIPNRGQIEIKGTGEFVDMFFGQISTRFELELVKAIKTFKGDLEMVEKRDGDNLEIQIVEKEKGNE